MVKKWTEDQSFKTEYNCLNVPEPKKLGSREEVENHFHETYAATIIKQVETYTVPGAAARHTFARSAAATSGAHRVWRATAFSVARGDEPEPAICGAWLAVFQSQQNAHTRVCRASALFGRSDAGAVSEGIRKIVDFINANPKTTRAAQII